MDAFIGMIEMDSCHRDGFRFRDSDAGCAQECSHGIFSMSLFIPGLIPALLHALSVSDKLVDYGLFTADK